MKLFESSWGWERRNKSNNRELIAVLINSLLKVFLPVETGKLSINKFFLAVRVGHLVSISYSCSKSCKVTTVLVNFNCISKSCGKVDVINCLKEKIPVSVWLRRIRIKDNQRCVVLLEPVERLSAFVSFRADVSIFLMIK